MKIRSKTCSSVGIESEKGLKKVYPSLPSLLNGFSAQQRPEDRIQRFLHVLYQDHIARSKGPLYRVQVAVSDKTSEESFNK